MGLFTKKKVPTGPPPPIIATTFDAPPAGTYPNIPSAGMGNAPDGWAPSEQQDNSDPTYNSSYRLEPIPDVAPAAWYAERNERNLNRGRIEDLQGGSPWPIESYENQEQLNPWIKDGPPPPDRVTGAVSPSTYRFLLEDDGEAVLPIGLHAPRQLNGNHFSQASLQRSYPINGMKPATHFRNTFRLQPPGLGTPALTDLPPVQPAPPPDQVQGLASVTSNSAFRLGS